MIHKFALNALSDVNYVLVMKLMIALIELIYNVH